MATHRVRYLDLASNAVRERRVDAPSEVEARRVVEADGGAVLQIAAERGFASVLGGRSESPRPMGPGDVALLCRELRALLGAGLSVVEALDALAVRRDGQSASAGVHVALLVRLREGRALSAAMRDVGGFPALLVASVQASERTSNLGEALDAYLHYDEMVGTLRRRVISASLYPGIVVTLGALVAAFLLVVVIPRFASLYGEMGSGAGSATMALMRLGVLLRDHSVAVVSGLVSMVIGIGALASGGRWHRFLTWCVAGVPWLSERIGHFEKARVYEALSLLVKGGYSLHEALGLCVGLNHSALGAQGLERARSALAQGVAVSPAFAAAGLTDAVTERLLRAGDRGGSFDRVLKAIGDRHARAFETFVERCTRVVEPLLLLGVALLVGGMVVLLYMPVFDIAASVR